MEKGEKSFIVSYSLGSALSLSFSPPFLLLILKQQIPFRVPPEQFHDLLWQPDPYGLNMASAHPSFSRDCWFLQWRKKWQPTPVFLPGEFFGWKGLVGCSPWGCRELDRTERLTHIDSYKGMLKSVKWYIFPYCVTFLVKLVINFKMLFSLFFFFWSTLNWRLGVYSSILTWRTKRKTRFAHWKMQRCACIWARTLV